MSGPTNPQVGLRIHYGMSKLRVGDDIVEVKSFGT